MDICHIILMFRRRLDSELNSQRTTSSTLKLGCGPIFSLQLGKLDEEQEELYDTGVVTSAPPAFKEVLLHLDLKGAPPKFDFLLDLIIQCTIELELAIALVANHLWQLHKVIFIHVAWMLNVDGILVLFLF